MLAPKYKQMNAFFARGMILLIMRYASKACLVHNHLTACTHNGAYMHYCRKIRPAKYLRRYLLKNPCRVMRNVKRNLIRQFEEN